MSEPVEPSAAAAQPTKRSELLSWTITALVVLGLAGALWLLPHPELPSSAADNQPGAVSITAGRTIRVRPGTPFQKRLHVAIAEEKQTEEAVLEVTGSVLASAPTHARPGSHAWEFATPELINSYSEWLQSSADVAFYQAQMANTRSLTQKRLESLEAVVDRLQRLVEVGSDSPRDLAQERANLMERKLESDRQIHEADADLNTSLRHQAALERQLEQAGLEPELLRDVVPGRVLLVADVPETRMAGLKEGQRCSVRLYAAPESALIGHVARVLPTLSTTQRTLRMLVMLDAPTEAARPGMFADVGIGTEARRAVMLPQVAIVHVGKADYILSEQGADTWRINAVELGAAEGEAVEVTSNLTPGTRVLADGVVLLKPVIAEVLSTGGQP